MDLRQLNALLAVADQGSFTAAADVLGTVQSNVSAHIARLEREVGAVLVDRSTGQLTEEGDAVAARARRVTVELEAVVGDLAALHDEVAGTVRIGMVGTVARWLAPHLLQTAAARHPKLYLVVVDGISTALEPQLATGQLDLAVVNPPAPSADLSFTPLFDEDLVLVVRADDPLAKRGPLELAELAGLDLLLPLPGTSFRDELDQAVRPQGITLMPRAELDGVRLIASLTFDGHGPAILPATAVPEYLRREWRLVQVKGIPRRRIGVAQRSRGLPSAPARVLLSILHDVVTEPANIPDELHVVPELVPTQ
ncbi:MAG TPA: LysR family transcriptional regulator [Acidimicrobiales bacterium]|nr:LysR family transcriptional regulator [Acidimicrobiales bacterium]